MTVLVGVDQGTSGTRAVAFDEQLQPLAESYQPAELRHPHPGWIEKDADTRAIETDLSANLRMLVRIDHNGPDDGGTLTIRYRTLDDLDLLCDVLSKIPRDMLNSRS